MHVRLFQNQGLVTHFMKATYVDKWRFDIDHNIFSDKLIHNEFPREEQSSLRRRRSVRAARFQIAQRSGRNEPCSSALRHIARSTIRRLLWRRRIGVSTDPTAELCRKHMFARKPARIADKLESIVLPFTSTLQIRYRAQLDAVEGKGVTLQKHCRDRPGKFSWHRHFY
jgi:hypothetical protein